MKYALILSGISWNDSFQRHHQIAIALSELGYKVIFVNSIPSSKFSFIKLINKIKYIKKRRKEKINNHKYSNITQKSLKLLWPGSLLINIWNKYIIKKYAKQNFENIDFDIVIAYLPIETTFHFLKNISYKKLVYDCVRNFQGWGGYPNNIKYWEQMLINKADKILCDSFYLKNYLNTLAKEKSPIQILPYVSSNINYLSMKIPSKIQKLAYIGTLDKHNDLELIQSLLDMNYTINIYGINNTTIVHKNFVDKGYYNNLSLLQTHIKEDNDAIIIPYKGYMDGVIPAKLPLAISIGIPVFINSFYDSIQLKNIFFVYKNDLDLYDLLQNFNFEAFKRNYKSGFNLFENCKSDLLKTTLANL